MVSLSLFPRLLVAQELDIKSLVGEEWYGLYLNGQKAGYSLNAVALEDGTVTVTEDARFRVSMSGIQQDMRIFVKRTYAQSGELRSIEQEVVDPAGTKRFNVRVEDSTMFLTTSVGGVDKERRMVKPKESLRDTLRQAELVQGGAKVGDSLTFTVFEPMYEKEIDGISRIDAVEDRILDGVSTKVFKVRSTLKALGLESVAYVAAGGKTLEDQIAGIITMRLEPKEMAQDVNYNNDVIVSNAATVDTPIENPRGRDSLRLRLTGPFTADHLFNDDRQTLTQKDGYVEFTGKKVSLDGFTAAQLPIKDESVAKYQKASLMIQSDDPRLIQKAKEILGDEKDSLAVATKLCHWVSSNVRTTYSAQLTNAIEVLERPEGDCTEHSVLFIGLARAAGLPAKEAAGLIYVTNAKPAFYFHQWASVWVGKWIDVDPTFDQPLADVTHIKLAEGDLFEQAKLIPAIGQIRIKVESE